MTQHAYISVTVPLTRDVSPQGVTGLRDTQTGVIVGVQHRFRAR